MQDVCQFREIGPMKLVESKSSWESQSYGYPFLGVQKINLAVFEGLYRDPPA